MKIKRAAEENGVQEPKKLKRGYEAKPDDSGNKKKFADTKGKKTPKGCELTEKPEDWNEFKKKKKELKVKRKQSKSGYDVIVKAKQIGEKLRCKTLKGGPIERNKLINELHSLLRGQNHYPKFVLAHDTSRIVQLLLKYSSDIVKDQISKELIPVALDMFQSKYGIFCLRRLVKYGNQETKTGIINKMYGNAVKLSTSVLSAQLFESIYSTWATPQQKYHLQQEFFGEMYKNSKDDSIKRLGDVFEKSPDLKTAALSATKANLLKVINKGLMDSTIVQSVLYQFLQECSEEDRNEIISLLIPHIVVISNSRDGVRAAMQCIWFGTNKDRKSAMKTIKEHVIEMCKHEHAHCAVITLLDTADDTVLLNKVILSEILKASKDLAVDEWGRKVLLWLVAPDDSVYFHPVFVKELQEGRNKSNSKKDLDVRRKEILDYSIKTLVNLIKDEPEVWLSKSSLALEMLGILKAAKGENMREVYDKIVKVIIDPAWKVKNAKLELPGIEEGGAHLVLKKLARHDKEFGDCLLDALTDDILKSWLTVNRACFLLVVVIEDRPKEMILKLLNKIRPHLKLLKEQKTSGGKFLLDAVYK